MPQSSFTADMSKWTDKARRNGRFIVMEASHEVYKRMTQVQPSVKDTGGSYEEGKVPVDIGMLIGSVVINVGAGEVRGQTGKAPEYMAAISGLKPGDLVQAAFTAEYAAHIEYGTVRFGGRFMVRNAIRGWKTFVATAAARYV